MDIGTILKTAAADIELAMPAIDGVVTAINPGAGAVLTAADKTIENYLPEVESLTATATKLVGQVNAIRSAAGVDPVVWDDIADSNVAADARFAASKPPSQ